jgi:hypothetical protein
MRKTKYQTLSVVVPSDTAAGIIEHEVSLDKPFTHCTGVVMYENNDGGTNCQIGLRDDEDTFHTLTDKRDWTAGESVSLNDRYKNILIPVTGNKLYVRTKHTSETTSDLKFDIVFRLEILEDGLTA